MLGTRLFYYFMDNICAHATTQGRWKGPMFPTGNNPHFLCGTWGEHWGLTEDCCPFCVWCRIPGGGILFFYGILSDGERSGLQAGHLLHICGLKAHWLDGNSCCSNIWIHLKALMVPFQTLKLPINARGINASPHHHQRCRLWNWMLTSWVAPLL